MTLQSADPLCNGENGVLLAKTQFLNMLLEDVLKGGDGSVILDDPNAGRERNDDGDGEVEVALARLLAVRECAVGERKISEERREGGRAQDEPVEHPEELHDPLFAAGSASRRNLNCELVDASVLSEDGKAAEVDTMAAIDVVLVCEV
jgi:hypothetical protein